MVFEEIFIEAGTVIHDVLEYDTSPFSQYNSVIHHILVILAHKLGN